MKRAIRISFLATLIAGVALGNASGQAGRATATAGGVSVDFVFQTAAAFPPSAPGNPEILSFTPTQLTVSWAPAVPALPNRAIDHYEVLRNGVKIGQTTEIQTTVGFDPTGMAFEFFSVRAVDSKGIASAGSGEVLAPNYTVNNSLQIRIEAKIAVAQGYKLGFPGFCQQGRFYKQLTYSENTVYHDDNNASKPPNGHTVSLAITASVDGQTGAATGTATGSFSSYGEVDFPANGTFRLSPANPYVVELVSDGNAVSTWWVLPHRLLPEESLDYGTDVLYYSDYDPNSSSDTEIVRSSNSSFGNSNSTFQLLDEFTGQELDGKVSTRYSQAFAQLGGSPWNTMIRIDDAGQTIAPGFGAQGFVHRFMDDDFDAHTYLDLSGGIYRLKVLSLGKQKIRWAEVTMPDDGSDEIVQIHEETVTVNDSNGGYTSEHAISPPSMPGTTFIRLLSNQVSVNTLSLAAVSDSSASRLFVQNAVFKGQSAEFNIMAGNAAYALDEFTSAIIAYAGTTGSIRLVAIDPQVEADQGTQAAIDAGQEIASGTDLLANPN